jgi:uncharacterized protein (TIGR02996 family)
MSGVSDDTALLNAIIASPGDDLPRLIFADWLDDRGEADRAEFIRVQCRIASPGCPSEIEMDAWKQPRP